jgi:hypothetical protein
MKAVAIWYQGSFRVKVDGRLTTPTWSQKGPAQAYADAINRGQREPEFERAARARIHAWIRAIRSAKKREYAYGWLAYCVGDKPKPEPGGLSVMGAQAVRMALAELGVADEPPAPDPAGDGQAAGRAAFVAGLKRTPAHDPAAERLIAKYSPDTKAVLAVLDGWLAGWDAANLA